MPRAKKVVSEPAPEVQKATSEVTHPISLYVVFDGAVPTIKFTGEWGVRHLLTIKRCLSREFKLHRRSIIRNTITTGG